MYFLVKYASIIRYRNYINMTWETNTSNNFLKKEIQESNTESSIKENTINILDKASELKKLALEKNPELFKKFQKEYEEIRNATILALKKERVNIKDELWNLKQDLVIDENLSDGKIDKYELWDISVEFWEFHEKMNNIDGDSWESTKTTAPVWKPPFWWNKKFGIINENTEEDKELNEYRDEADEILSKYSNVNDLINSDGIQEKIDRRELLNNKYIINSSCISGKNVEKYSEIKEKIINKEKSNIKEILKWYTINWKKLNINDIFKIDETKCDPLNLVKRLENLKGPNRENLSEEKIKQILDWVLILRNNNLEVKLWNILKKYNLKITDFNDKNSKEIEEVIEEKNVSKEDKKLILEKLWTLEKNKDIKNNLEKTENIENFKEVLINSESLLWIKKYLKENEEVFLKVVNSLGIYKNKATNIEVVTLSTYTFNKLNELNSKWLLDNNPKALELLSILDSYFNMEISNKKLIWKELDHNEENFLETKINYEQNHNINKNYKEQIFENQDYNPKTWTLPITNEYWKIEKIKLTPYEMVLVNKRPETLEKIVDFYKILDKVWLSELWNIKEQIFKAIWWIGFSTNDKNYLSENETKIFLNSILKSVWENEIDTVFSLNEFQNQIEIMNKTQIWWVEKTYNNIYSETYLEYKFNEKFVPRESGIIWFRYNDFIKAIS